MLPSSAHNWGLTAHMELQGVKYADMARGLPNERLIVEHPLALHELVPL